MEINKTPSPLLIFYYCTETTKAVKNMYRSCLGCQITRPQGKFQKAQSTLQSGPFEKVPMNITGPVRFPSYRANTHFLIMVNLCKMWPEAILMRSITSEAVSDALLLICSRFDSRNTISSDNVQQFTSQSTKLVLQNVGVHQVFLRPYHPQTNDTVERVNSTLKAMLAKAN